MLYLIGKLNLDTKLDTKTPLNANQSTKNLMDINHMRWEFSIHIFGNELNIENCKYTNLNVEETLWSMFERYLEQ